MTDDDRAAADERLSDALAGLWRAIRARHPELPATAPIVASPGRPGGFLEGPLTLRYSRDNALRVDAPTTLAALLREAAHELGAARGVHTTSRKGHYHNQRFADLSREVGLDVAEHDPTKRGGGTRGWSRVRVPQETAEAYAEPVAELAAALRAYPRRDVTPRRTGGGGKVAIVCACPRTLWTSRTEAERGGVQCDICGAAFAAKDATTEAPFPD